MKYTKNRSKLPHFMVGQYVKSKQLPFIEKCICLAILSFNRVYNFSFIIFL